MPTQGFGLSQMIQHRKQGTGFVMELEEKLATGYRGCGRLGFSILPELCAVANYRTASKILFISCIA
jgi:hypothetical protein